MAWWLTSPYTSQTVRTAAYQTRIFMCFALSAPSSRTANGGLKQRRVYELDEDGNRIRDQNGEFVFNAVPTTDWGSPETLEYWRQTGRSYAMPSLRKRELDVRIDHRSYERQGVELLPTVHEGRNRPGNGEERAYAPRRASFNRWNQSNQCRYP